jgi:hypothetical protein
VRGHRYGSGTNLSPSAEIIGTKVLLFAQEIATMVYLIGCQDTG